MKYIVSADAGGTKTRAVLLDEKSNILTESRSGCGNLALDYPDAENNILSAVSEVIQSSESPPCAVVIGAAGISAEGAADRLKSRLISEFSLPVYITSDGILALYSALGDKDGMTVVSGTGSIILAKKQNEICRTGGWGHLLGEKGSGASIGYSLLTHICDCRDKGCPDKEAENSVFRELGITTFGEMISYVYSHPKSDIARLAAAENDLALSGNRDAESRLKKAAADLCECTAEMYTRLGFKSEKICVSGGCFAHAGIFRDEFFRTLARKLPSAELTDEKTDPVLGGFHICRQFAERKDE